MRSVKSVLGVQTGLGIHSRFHQLWIEEPFINLETRNNVLITTYHGHYKAFKIIIIWQN